MKPPLLVLSLGANVSLLTGVTYLTFTPPTRLTSEQPKDSATLALPKPASSSQSQPPDLATIPAPAALTPGTWQSPAEVVGWLLSTNAPLKARHAVAQSLLGNK